MSGIEFVAYWTIGGFIVCSIIMLLIGVVILRRRVKRGDVR